MDARLDIEPAAPLLGSGLSNGVRLGYRDFRTVGLISSGRLREETASWEAASRSGYSLSRAKSPVVGVTVKVSLEP